MIRFGRYDKFDKWEIVSRGWSGETIDVGVDRHGRTLLPEWGFAAFTGGSRAVHDYLRLKHEAINPDAQKSDQGATDAETQLDEISSLLETVEHGELLARSEQLLEHIRTSGPLAPFKTDLPAAVISRLTEVFKSGALVGLSWTDDIDEIPDVDVMRTKVRDIAYLKQQKIDALLAQGFFPADAVRGKRTVLSMFCARYYGLMDVIHVYDSRPDQVTLVDFDKNCLDAMQQIYPTEWTYIHSDYMEFLQDAERRKLIYDLVIMDPWAPQCKDIILNKLPMIAQHSSDTIITHCTQEVLDELETTLEDCEGLSRAISQRTGVGVTVTQTVRRGRINGWVVMRKQPH